MIIETVTPTRIYFKSFEKSGTASTQGLHIVPLTPYLAEKYNLNVPEHFYNIPSVQLDNPSKYARLRGYQLDDVKRLAATDVGIIASEPRTGKTPTSISVFRAKQLQNFLVVVPASIIKQWESEIKEWYPELEYVYAYHGTVEQRQKLFMKWKATQGALVISYETLRNDLKSIIKIKDIDGIIVDEGHKIKNPKSKNYRAVASFKKVKNKLWLSGTLAPNKPEEVFTALAFTHPDIFTGYRKFTDYYFEQMTEYNYALRKEITNIGRVNNEYELPQFLNRVAIQRKQIDALQWLQENTVKPYRVALEPTVIQATMIRQLLTKFEVEGTDIIAQGVLDQLTYIRQICVSPELLGVGGYSPKTNYIKKYIEKYPDKSVIIFSSFTRYIKKLHEELPGSEMIIGDTPIKRRDILKLKFQAGKIKILIINTKSGKEGLTLDTGDAVIFSDVFPPAADVTQARERITATSVDKMGDKQIIELVMHGTYDEKLYDLVDKNYSLTDVVNNFKEYGGVE